jgi:hypothetical protein
MTLRDARCGQFKTPFCQKFPRERIGYINSFGLPRATPPPPSPRTGQDGTRKQSFHASRCVMTGERRKIKTRTTTFIDTDFVTHRA